MATMTAPVDDLETHASGGTEAAIAEADAYTAHNYHPLPVVRRAAARAPGSTDVEGRRYLDMLAGYSALNFGHRHPRADRGGRAPARAAHADQPRLPQRPARAPSPRELAELCGMDMVLPMNTGAEAVETALKVARKWGYEVKGVARGPGADRRRWTATSTAGRRRSSASPDDPAARDGLRPVHAGLRHRARTATWRRSDAAIDDDTVAVLLEPIQGEAGVHRPARRLPGRRPRAVHRAQRPDDRRRDPVGPRPHRQHVRVRPRGRRPGRVRARQGARRRDRAGVGRGRPRGRARRVHARRARLDVRRQPAGLRGRDRRSSGCSRPASSRSGPASSASCLAGPARRAPGGSRVGVPRRAGCGPASTSSRLGPAATCASG